MKIFKAGLIAQILIFSFLNSVAQPGIRAGAHISNIDGYNGSQPSHGFSWQPGFNVAVFYDIRLMEDLFIQPAFSFATKGYKNKISTGTETIVQQIIPHYLEVPVIVLYKPAIGSGNLIGGGGIYFGRGVGGKWKSTPDYVKGDLVFVKDYEDYYEMDTYSKRVFGIKSDFGITAQIGYQFAQKISVTLHGNYGLKDITPTKGGEKLQMKQINTQIGLSAGYSF